MRTLQRGRAANLPLKSEVIPNREDDPYDAGDDRSSSRQGCADRHSLSFSRFTRATAHPSPCLRSARTSPHGAITLVWPTNLNLPSTPARLADTTNAVFSMALA